MPDEPVAPPRKRRWFQIHLSTLFVASLVAGGLMCVFFTPTPMRTDGLKMGKLGFPWTAAYKIDFVGRYTATSVELFGERHFVERGDYIVSHEFLAADLAFIFAMLGIAVYILEWPIVREEAERAAKKANRGLRIRVELPPQIPEQPEPVRRWHRLSAVSMLLCAMTALVVLGLNCTPQRDNQAELVQTNFGWPWAASCKTEFADPNAQTVWNTAWRSWAGNFSMGGFLILALGFVAETACRNNERTSPKTRPAGGEFRRNKKSLPTRTP